MEGNITILIEDYIELRAKSEKLDVILNLIFSKASKSSYSDELYLNDTDSELRTYLKIVESQKYNERLNELNKEEE